MAKQKKSKLVNIITWVLLLLLLIGGIVGLVRLLWLGIDDDAFRVEYDGKIYKSGNAENVLSLPENGQARFDVKGAASYTLSVVPNADFNYTVNDQPHTFLEEQDITACFEIEQHYGYFTIESGDYTIEGVLTKLWGETADIQLGNFIVYLPFKLNVISADGNTVEIAFGGEYAHMLPNADDIKLNLNEIYF